MDEQDGAEFFGLGPNRVEFGIGEILSQHAGADRGAARIRKAIQQHRPSGAMRFEPLAGEHDERVEDQESRDQRRRSEESTHRTF